MSLPNRHDLSHSTDNDEHRAPHRVFHEHPSQKIGFAAASSSPCKARQHKAGRATLACDQCHTRKAKCDEGWPTCGRCKANNLICGYKEVPPRKSALLFSNNEANQES
ncbi:hypothetical protein N7523_005687 [Penicillium sp. IBT 18751x]|nr:hypothetical protein N7523_005687 [Penicillium sp. IBT 18751x]